MKKFLLVSLIVLLFFRFSLDVLVARERLISKIFNRNLVLLHEGKSVLRRES